ncbi:Glycosyltransferase [Methanosarcina siciliae HI350]|uniref:Glycosyltransferase n=1 Tax=Methanosarcina siciliae HI350 TaxID=1434119 RepID=A0A0E3PFW8_9EURY|nr:glycosyltransferase family 4 protein [Methanosarcina siciliae]AKB33649.1 Glycosyltransferase [Methanosarcina siciliae HI350]
MLRRATNRCVLSVCDISPKKCGSFEEFLISITEKLREKEVSHIIIFRSKPIELVEETLLEKGAEIKILKPSKLSILNLVPLYNIIKESRPQIVHFHFYPIYTVMNYLGYILGIKVIYTDHMGHKKAHTFLKKMVRRIYYHTGSMFFEFGINNIVCVSNFVKDKYRREYGINSKKLCTIYNGINTERFRKTCNNKKIMEKYNIKDEFVVICVGLKKDKGVNYLIDAAPKILKEVPKTKFILIGEDKYRSELEKHIDELNIKNHFIFSGNIEFIEEIYNITSCVVIPSLVDEAFCFVAAEAMSTEVPIVAFDSGALEEVIYDKSNIVPRNPEALADKIIEYLKKDNVSGELARKHVIENFSLDKNISNYVKMYEELLNN